MNATALLAPGFRRVEGHAIKKEKNNRRKDELGDHRMPGNAIEPSPANWQIEILLKREAAGVYIGASVALVQIVPGGMVTGVLSPPIRVRRIGHDAAKPTHDLVCMRR